MVCFSSFKVLSKGFSIILRAIGQKGRSIDFFFFFWMFHGVICKYFGRGLSVYILESNIKPMSIYMHKSNFQKSWGGGGYCPLIPKRSFVLGANRVV